jgi:hypothetical protein
MEQLLLNILSISTLVGMIGYLLHSVFTGYKEFKKDAYKKLDELDDQKMSKRECNEYRIYERRELDHHRADSNDGTERHNRGS